MSPRNVPEGVLYIDRSGAELDDTCEHAFWWNRIHGERGIVAKGEAFYFQLGRETHEDLAMVAELEEVNPYVLDEKVRSITDALSDDDRRESSVMEPLYRRLGWLAAYGQYIEPLIRRDYTNVQTEAELILDRTPLWVGVTPDRVLRRRGEGYLVYREYKTSITAGKNWMDYWPTAIQLHLGMAVVQEELGERVLFSQVMGLMKGYVGKDRLHHPYVWAYVKGDEWTHEYKPGWEARPVWEYPGGVMDWVLRCGEDVAREQFPHSAPVTLDERKLNNWVQARTARMQEIQVVKELCRGDEEKRRIYFKQVDKNCRPAFGNPCQYRAACWNATVGEDPLRSGLYEKRVPHHDIELVVTQGGE